MRTTRTRRAAAVTFVAAAMLALAACGGSGDGEGGDAAETRSVTDATGAEVKVPVEPKKIVALSEQDLDGLLALGVKPAGTVNGRGQQTPPAYLGDLTAGIAIVGTVAEPALDAVNDLEPDLILAGGVADEQRLAALRDIAPTVVTYKPETDWKTAFKKTAEAVNKSTAADTWLADYDTEAGDAKTAIAAHAGESVSIIRWNPDGPVVMLKDSFASLVVQDAGLVRPDTQQDPGFAHTDVLGLENLDKADGDWIFAATLQPGSAEALTEAKETPAFAALGAVKAERFVEVDGTLWTSRGGPLGALKVLEDLKSNLSA
ncbi:iron-siderophore ABC transporter substrate-binding protein [Phytomonospora sp. NPDC050363]|uniref:iron-siderophore ABC transporter substrate-binding protein n=1 Tax=Phytomonospora sp. NPDC050363 TaxID=3155642 RepID=UPI0033C01F7A